MTRAAPLAVTLGDPAGIGPEIVAKAWAALRQSGPAFLVVGDHRALAAAVSDAGAGTVCRVASPGEAEAAFADALPILDLALEHDVVAGRPSAAHARAVIGWIETAAGLARSGTVRAVVTAPIAKKPLYDGGFAFAGHTEFLADRVADAPFAGRRGPVMMLATHELDVPLRTALVTVHCALRDAPALLSVDKLVHVGRVLDDALRRDFGVARPVLAMAALNPHAGEGGALGSEEAAILDPAAAALRALGVDCSDARPADTLFHEGARRGYDAVICQHHDQALIPLKTLDFWGGVNITLGLPIVRTSPDHGTGFDIAGRGVARPDSLIAAIRTANAIAERRASGGA